MTRILLCCTLLATALPPFAMALDTGLLLRGIEDRYNRAKTLQVQFRETYSVQGRGRKSESGTLSLRKPGRMRWDYTDPVGKVFVSDGKFLWLYTPDNKRAEKAKLKESEDMRAPLAFLLGKLDFGKEFEQFQVTPKGNDLLLQAKPKASSLPYSDVTFLIGSDYQIRQLTVTGQDRSVLEFAFDRENVNPKLDDKLFRFDLPPGAEFVDMSVEKAEKK